MKCLEEAEKTGKQEKINIKSYKYGKHSTISEIILNVSDLSTTLKGSTLD